MSYKKVFGLAVVSAITLLGSMTTQASGEDMIWPNGVYSSSELWEEGYDHNAWNLFDGDLSSSWTEGVSGTGVGEYVEILLPEDVKVTGGIIYPGFLKNEDLFWKNAAPSVIEISAAGGSTTIDCAAFANSYSEACGGCYFWLGEELEHDGSIYVTVRGVRDGWKYTDTCFSELTLFGTGMPDEGMIDPEMKKSSLVSFAYWLYEWQQGMDGLQEAEIVLGDLTSAAKGMGVYWLQYHGMDFRVEPLGEYNAVTEDDLWDIWCELYGSVEPEDMDVFREKFVQYMEGDTVYMYGTGDFGAVGEYFFKEADVIEETEESIFLSGDVMEWDGAGDYMSTHRYEIWYSVEKEGLLGRYQFEEMKIVEG